MECEAAGSSSKTINITATRSSTLNNVAKWSRRYPNKTYRVTYDSKTWYVENGRRFQKRSSSSWSKFAKALFGTFCAAAFVANPAAAATTTGGASLLTFNTPQFLLTANSGTSTGPTSSFDGDWVRGELLLTFTRSDDTYGMGANINGAGNIELFNETATLLVGISGPTASVSYEPTWLHRNATWGSQFLAGGSRNANGREPYGRTVRLKDGHLSLPGGEFPLMPVDNDDCGYSGSHAPSGTALSRLHVGCIDDIDSAIYLRQFNPVSGTPVGSMITLPTPGESARSTRVLAIPPYSLELHFDDNKLEGQLAQAGSTVGSRAFFGLGSTSFLRMNGAPVTATRALVQYLDSGSSRLYARLVDVGPGGASLVGSQFTIWPSSILNSDADHQIASISPYVLSIWDRGGTWRYRILCVQGSTIAALSDATILPALAGADRATLRADPEHNRFYLQYEVGEDLYMMRIELNTGIGATTATSGLTSGTSTGVTSGITSGFTTGITSGGSGTVPTATPLASPPPPSPTPTPPIPTPTPRSAPAPEGAPPPKRPNPTVPIVLGTLGGITLLGFVVCLGKRRKERSTKDDFTDSAFATHEMTAVDRGPHYASPVGTPAVSDGGYMAAPGASADQYGTPTRRPVSDAGYVHASNI